MKVNTYTVTYARKYVYNRVLINVNLMWALALQKFQKVLK